MGRLTCISLVTEEVKIIVLKALTSISLQFAAEISRPKPDHLPGLDREAFINAFS